MTKYHRIPRLGQRHRCCCSTIRTTCTMKQNETPTRKQRMLSSTAYPFVHLPINQVSGTATALRTHNAARTRTKHPPRTRPHGMYAPPCILRSLLHPKRRQERAMKAKEKKKKDKTVSAATIASKTEPPVAKRDLPHV